MEALVEGGAERDRRRGGSGRVERGHMSVTIVGAAVVELSGDMDGPELSGAAVGAVGAELSGAAAGVPCEQTVEPGLS